MREPPLVPPYNVCFESLTLSDMSLRLSSLFSMKEEESEEEPKLKYERLSNGVTEILQKDAASCMTVHDKFLALGTHYGKVYLLDVQGNITQKFDVVSIQYKIMYKLNFMLKFVL